MIIFLSMLESDREREEFLKFYHQYGNAMLLATGKIFPYDQGLAEDAVQNAWIKVIKNFSRVQSVPKEKRGAYLVVIAKNEAVSILRKRSQEIPLEEVIPEERDIFEDSAQPVLEIIQQMSETYRTILEMRFVEGYSAKEIARKLQLTEAAVNTRIHRGRLLLIKKLKEEGSGV